MTHITQPRIYVACLAAYNNGILHGAWIDATDGIDALWQAVRQVLKVSPIGNSEEFAIHDHEGFGSAGISEYESLDSVNAKAEFITEHGETGLLVLDHCCGDLDDAKDMIERYSGTFTSLADYAEEIISQTETITSWLEPYIDYAAIARDMEINGDLDSIEAGYERVLIFTGR